MGSYRQFGKIIVRGVSTAGTERQAAERLVNDHLTALSEGGDAPKGLELARMSWLEFALNPFPDLFGGPPGGVSVKVKDALPRCDGFGPARFDPRHRLQHGLAGSGGGG